MYYIKLLNKDKYKIFKAARVNTTFFFQQSKKKNNTRFFSRNNNSRKKKKLHFNFFQVY